MTTLSFAGCRSRAEARERFARWFDDLQAQQRRKNMTNAILDDLDADALDDLIATIDGSIDRGRAEALEQFDRFLDLHLNEHQER